MNKAEPQYVDRRAATRRIIALDGEGKNLPMTPGVVSANPVANEHGWHSYTLLVAADDEGNRRHVQHDYSRREWSADAPDVARNYGLPTITALDFILALPEDALLVGFYFSYDVVKILADLPIENLRELADDSPAAKREKRENKTIWGDYLLEYRPRKYFKIARISDGPKFRRRKRNGKMGWEKEGWKTQRIVWDIFGFFQKSFVKALQDSPELFDPNVVKRIADMKTQRADFDHLEDDRILDYCVDECVYLAKLFRDMLVHIENMDLKLSRFDGAGALASAYYKKIGIKDHIATAGLPNEVALAGYYGGRFEISEIGRIGDVYSYDINSAYPAIIASLPCLACGGEFKPTAEYVPGRIGIYRVGSNTHGRTFAPFPFRADDEMAKRLKGLPDDAINVGPLSIFYAHGGQRWVWQDELAIARKHYGADAIPIYEGWVFYPGCDHKPFDAIPGLYRKRKELKRDGNGAEKVYKLMLNSLYGKLAQSIGWTIGNDGTPQPPPFQSFIWAGLITSGTRAMILDAVCQGDVVSIATDGILSRTEIPSLPVGPDLGDWEDGPGREFYLFQSGVYCGDVFDKGKWKHQFKTRGFSANEVPDAKLIAAWGRGHRIKQRDCEMCQEIGHGCSTLIRPESEAQRFIPIKLGVLLNNATDLIGQWVTSAHEVKISHTRRILVVDDYDDMGIPDLNGSGNMRSEPFHVPDDFLSSPYKPKESWEDLTGDSAPPSEDGYEATVKDLDRWGA